MRNWLTCWSHSTPRSTKTCSNGRLGISRGSDHRGSSHELSTLRDETRRWRKGWSGQGGPVRLLVGIRQVVGEPSCRGVPVEELVEGKCAGQRTRPADVAGELLAEALAQALHEQALPGRQGTLLPAGGPPCPDQDELQGPIRSAARLERTQGLGDLASPEL